MIKHRFFACFLDIQENWINKMAQKGLRLTNVSGCKYEFIPASENYEYCVDLILDKTQKDAKSYIDFLHESGYKTFQTKINLNWSFGKAKLRLGDERIFHLGKMNKEVVIIEKKKDGKSFNIYSTNADKRRYYKRLRNMFIPVFVLCGVTMIDGLLTRYICKNTITLYFSILLFICLLILILFYQSKMYYTNKLEE